MPPSSRQVGHESPALPIGWHLGRLLTKLAASRSGYVLTAKDAAPPSLWTELSEFGVFIELAYNAIPVEMVCASVDVLTQPHYPLQGALFLRDLKLLESFGGAACVPAFTAYRPAQRQVVLAISGAQSVRHMWHFLQMTKCAHPAGDGCQVHSGLWSFYQLFKDHAVSAVRSALKGEAGKVEELVIVGHSMGGALGYLLALDLLGNDALLPSGLTLKLAFFGTARVGNEELCSLWRQRVRSYREKNGENSLDDYSVKINNDVTPSLPLYRWGYRTFSDTPLYSHGRRLFHIPYSEREHSIFEVSMDSQESEQLTAFPDGGHTYYNDRDMVVSVNRLAWLGKNMEKTPGWREQYRKMVISQGEAWEEG
ncbi:alpha/beta-hydrolase [Gloeophyllum trabeum ATCC 11539]|uniref:Alpha/beta-hydrolase n=1 Tax=Gloeophyllum trabeum (strain ATCC 11539 / FP-39264 / Madison 617) TaxID=670483 RepID=S7PZ77_GLOTA|nr:alpha/beta-hydrolase [Gloeophyllum trabeum ATCC 11539]EPQ52592.1 alpha/beta-hydrolase [Gloeophyllum trabeum ATCC 11539]